MKDIVIVDAVRTAVGNFNGSLSKISAPEMGAELIKALINRNNISSEIIDEAIIGQVLQAGSGQNPARQSVIKSGLPNKTTAITINQVCGSGLKAVAMAMMSIQTGNSNVVIAGGQENMSLAPHVIKLREGTKMGNANLIDSMINDGLTDAFFSYHMGITAENIAKKWNISREEQDSFALKSQQKAEKAIKKGRFVEEIIPIKIKSKKDEIMFTQDEFPKIDATIEGLSAIRPAFIPKEGTVTAGNASGLNDGAALLLIMSREKCESLGLKPIAKIVSWAEAGVDPEIMGIGPVEAVKKALERSKWKISDLDLIEANEAFASQAIAVNKELGWNTEKVNVNGGAISLGHPIGASGARILVSLVHEMKKSKKNKGLATLCIGGGMGIAMTVELEK